MAKKATGLVKLQIAAGKATPAPPVGPALGQAQINIMEFCKQFNARTNQKELEGLIIPVVVTVDNTTAHGTAMSGGRRRNHEESREKHHESSAGGGSASVSVEGRRSAAAKSEIRQI